MLLRAIHTNTIPHVHAAAVVVVVVVANHTYLPCVVTYPCEDTLSPLPKLVPFVVLLVR